MSYSIILILLFPLVMLTRNRNGFISVFSWIVILALISLRGEYGPDTWTYYTQAKEFHYRDLSEYSLLQPLWIIFPFLLNLIGAGSSLLKFNFATGIVFVLLFWWVVRSKPLNTAILAFLPILIVDLAMNTNRVGIALLFLVVLRNTYFTSITPLIHVSTVPIVMYQYIKHRLRQSILLFPLILFASYNYSAELLILFAPIVQHADLYSSYEFGGEYRGLTDIVIVFLLANSDIYRGKLNLKVLISSFCFCYFLFYLAAENYAFLRLTKLALYYYVLTNIAYDSNKVSKLQFRSSLTIFYIFSMVVFYRMIMGFGIYGL